MGGMGIFILYLTTLFFSMLSVYVFFCVATSQEMCGHQKRRGLCNEDHCHLVKKNTSKVAGGANP